MRLRVADVLDGYGAMLDRLTVGIEDPAEIFAASFRMTGRLFRQRPQESEILLANGLALLSSDRGLAPRGAARHQSRHRGREVPSRGSRTSPRHGRRGAVGARETVA